MQQLCRVTPRVSLHFPWDKVTDLKAVRERGAQLGIGFDAVNSNTFQDQAGQLRSYRFGSLSHTSPTVREQAVKHNIECIETGQALGSKALTVWVGDGTNFPGQQALSDPWTGTWKAPAPFMWPFRTGGGCSSNTNSTSPRFIRP